MRKSSAALALARANGQPGYAGTNIIVLWLTRWVKLKLVGLKPELGGLKLTLGGLKMLLWGLKLFFGGLKLELKRRRLKV